MRAMSLPVGACDGWCGHTSRRNQSKTSKNKLKSKEKQVAQSMDIQVGPNFQISITHLNFVSPWRIPIL